MKSLCLSCLRVVEVSLTDYEAADYGKGMCVCGGEVCTCSLCLRNIESLLQWDWSKPYPHCKMPIYAWTPKEGAVISDLWTFSPVSDYPGKHPTEKPIALMEHIIKISTRPGDTILDFCMGNGTTLKAAYNLGRKAVGVDISKSYCNQAIKRLQQINLFSPDLIEKMGNSGDSSAKQLRIKLV